MTSNIGRMLKVALITCLAFTGAALAAVPLASAAECEAGYGGDNGLWVRCKSNGPGACGAAAYASATGSSGAGCFAADYPSNDE